MIIESNKFGMTPGKEIAKELNGLLASLPCDEPTEIVFEQGNYFLDADNCPVEHFHITNTIGEKEYLPEEEKWRTPVGILLRRLKNVTLNGNGSVFVIDGVATNIAVTDCENVTIKNLEIRVLQPNLHRLTVTKRSLFHAEFAVDAHSEYVTENGKIVFVGKGYRFPIDYRLKANYFNTLLPEDKLYCSRIEHPLRTARSVREKEKNVLVADGFFPKKRVKKGQDFYLFDNRRVQAGVFLSGSKNTTLENFSQRFSYSLSVVAQDCEGLTFDRVDLSPQKDSSVQFCSLSDFLHLCCCRGQITVRNSYFSSSGDDVLNVHGIHFAVERAEGNDIFVRFRHPQAYGFNIFHVGDTIAFVDRTDLLEKEQAKVVASELVDLYTVKITLDTRTKSSYVGKVVENISACPDVLFEKNRFDRVSTRGLLLTTRGKVVVRDNDFIFTKMWAIEISDDARNWYESGPVRDVTVENNRFLRCDQEMIHVYPMNAIHRGYVHTNITVRNNEFHLGKRPCYAFRSAGNVRVEGNTYYHTHGKKVRVFSVNSEIVKKDF